MRRQDGISLLEVLLMLTVTITMVGALSPALSAVVRDAKITVTVQNEATLRAAILRAFTTPSDTSCSAMTVNGACNGNKVNLVVGDGDIPTCPGAQTGCAGGISSWNRVVNALTTVGNSVDFLERHLVTNNPLGLSANDYSLPLWKGAYVNGPIDADPWGNRYMFNNESLNTTNSAWVHSAGPDGIIDTVFLGIWGTTAGVPSTGVGADNDIMTLVQQ